MNAFLAEQNLQIKDVAQPARVALTGRSASPGLFQVLFVLGKDVSLARLAKAAQLSEA
jgi:glutamyl-tRNA synthetase